MLSALILLPLDAVVIMVLMQVFAREKADFMKSLFTALVGSVSAAGLTFLLAPLSYPGIIAAAIVAVCVGVAISFVFHIEIKRALLIGIVFFVIRAGILSLFF